MNQATYCPEDNKLRLYVGRVPRDEYEALRAEGWTSTPKQDCDFVATWTPDREARCLEYADMIEDEDATPEDRAADRAERFGEYRDKRTGEALGHADTFDAGPSAHGFQSQARAERSAARHDRHAGRACDAWSKAEYWQRRTAGVISHALYKSTPAVRMGRIKEIEADLRRIEKQLAEYAETFARWKHVLEMTNPDAQNALALKYAYLEHGDYTHPRTGRKSYLYDLGRAEEEREADPLNGAELAALWLSVHREPKTETKWTTHLRLRLAYENQMLEAAGGRAAFVEMEAGGWIGRHQIQKVNRSPVTQRTVSVQILAPTGASYDRKGKAYGEDNPRPLTLHTLKVERMPADAYRPPTDEERAQFVEEKKERKAAAPKAPPCPLVNPTDEDAQRLQDAWNERARDEWTKAKGYGDFEPAPVVRIKQATYSEAAKGAYARAETRELFADMELADWKSNMWDRATEERRARLGAPVCKIRNTSGGKGAYGWGLRSVIVITDAPQKPLPAAVWRPVSIAIPEPAEESDSIQCEKCNGAFSAEKWARSTSVLFARGIVCPGCDFHQEGPFVLEAETLEA